MHIVLCNSTFWEIASLHVLHLATLLGFHRGSGAGRSRFTLFVVVVVLGVVVVFAVVVENEGSNLRGGLNLYPPAKLRVSSVHMFNKRGSAVFHTTFKMSVGDWEDQFFTDISSSQSAFSMFGVL